MLDSGDYNGSNSKRERRVTIVDVANHAGVSVASASKVLRDARGVSEAMRHRVSASMATLEYRPHRPARGMRGRTFTVGMMVSDIENPFFSLLLTGITDILEQHGYEILVAPGGVTGATQRAMTDAVIDHQMDGIVLVSPRASDAELDRIARTIPVVLVGRRSDSGMLDSVSGDDELGATLVVNHFVGLGHERIAFLTHHNTADQPEFPETRRARGYLSAMAEHGLPGQVIPGAWSLEGGRAAARMLPSLSPRPTAVHAGADIAAFGLMSEIRAEGGVGGPAVSLAGYDNSPISSIAPISLTTVDQSGIEMGRRAALLLLERITGRELSHHELMTPTLVVRASSRPPGK